MTPSSSTGDRFWRWESESLKMQRCKMNTFQASVRGDIIICKTSIFTLFHFYMLSDYSILKLTVAAHIFLSQIPSSSKWKSVWILASVTTYLSRIWRSLFYRHLSKTIGPQKHCTSLSASYPTPLGFSSCWAQLSYQRKKGKQGHPIFPL